MDVTSLSDALSRQKIIASGHYRSDIAGVQFRDHVGRAWLELIDHYEEAKELQGAILIPILYRPLPKSDHSVPFACLLRENITKIFRNLLAHGTNNFGRSFDQKFFGVLNLNYNAHSLQSGFEFISLKDFDPLLIEKD